MSRTAWAGDGSVADLSAYVDEELPALRRLRLTLHLRRCEACRRYVEQLRVVAGLGRELGVSARSASARTPPGVPPVSRE